MNGLDILIVAVLLLAVAMGFFQGIIRAILSLAGLVSGGILAIKYYAALSLKLTFISDANLAKVVAFLLIFTAVIVAASIVASVLKKVVHWLGAGWADRVGGALFGLVSGATFWGTMLNWLMANPSLGLRPIIEKSSIAILLLNWYHWLFGVVPPGTPI